MKSKVKIKKINNYILKTKLTPDIKNKNNTLWLFSFAIGKSIHQINDWLNQRKNKRAKKLSAQCIAVLSQKNADLGRQRCI